MQARDLTSKLRNDERDEDREGVFEDRAARARLFAVEPGRTARMAATSSAVGAYSHVAGEGWKPYEAPPAGPATVSR